MTRNNSLAARLRDGLWRGHPLGQVRMLDAHGHLGAWIPARVHNCDAASMVAAMDRAGVELALLSHFAGLSSNIQYGNDQVAAAAEQFPGRFLGYAVVNPHDPDQVRAEVQRCFERGWFVGAKLHTWHGGATASHPGYEGLWEYANAHRLIVLNHGTSAAELEVLSSRWADITFVVAHGASADLAADDPFLPLYRERPHVFADTSGSMMVPGALARLVERIGPQKILFGSDFPLIDLAHQLGRPLWAELDDDSLRLILGANLLDLLARIPGLGGRLCEPTLGATPSPVSGEL